MLVLFLAVSFAQRRYISFDDSFRFKRGDSTGVVPLCGLNDFPEDLGQTQCMGLQRARVGAELSECQDACCVDVNCQTWQFCPPDQGCASKEVPAGSCWIGNKTNCHATTLGWISRGRTTPAPPHARPCNLDYCKTSFDDSSWSAVDVPHDWSASDLPPQDQDDVTPVWSVREGEWLFHEGDNMQWANPQFDDSTWTKVNAPLDWRDPPLNYTDENSWGWFRRHIVPPPEVALRADEGNMRLDLGTVASFDQTFLNGLLIGSMGSSSNPNCKDDLDYRAYDVGVGILKQGEVAVIAVRVFSQGKKKPGGLFDSGEPESRIGPLDAAASPGQRQTGYAVGGVGWYRKHFKLSNDMQTMVRFDGVYMNSDMWLNEQFLGNHPYGYTTFDYDITRFLKDGDNVLAVRVANTGENSRWYSGSGIFRHVSIIQLPAVRIFFPHGVYVTTQVQQQKAIVRVEVSVENSGQTVEDVGVQVVVVDPQGSVVATNSSGSVRLDPGAVGNITYFLTVNSPQLWDVDHPWLYTAMTQVRSDVLNVSFGIRTLSFSTQGFQLNGEYVKLRGGCFHHDHGPLGSASVDAAEYRRVRLLKQQGYNAIRTSHNPASPALLDACDQLGLLVMEEAFDCFSGGKNPDDYHLYFYQWWQQDMVSMVARDRNRPSIIMWSIGNEIPIRTTPEGISLSKQLSDRVRLLDPHGGRAVTSAVPGVSASDDPFFAPLDVAGYNYSPQNYVPDHQRLPNRIMVATESFPADTFDYWMAVEDYSWVLGDFIWTSIDYLGESAIGSNGMYPPSLDACGGYCTTGWSYHVSYCGDIDVLGDRKPQSYLRAVLWNVSLLEMSVHAPRPGNSSEVIGGWGFPDERQSWTWPASSSLLVNVYSRLPWVQLFLNGVPVSSPQPVSRKTRFTYSVTLSYTPGNLTAVGFLDPSKPPVANRTLITTGTATKIGLFPDRSTLTASRSDASFISIRLLDSASRPVSQDGWLLVLTLEGNGEVAGAGNADPTNAQSYRSMTCVTFRGVCLAVVRPGSAEKVPSPGVISLTVEATGLQNAKVDLTVT